MALYLSVIVCTHNPKSDYLNQALDALKYQSLGYTFWELLIVDNASEQLIASVIDLSWHPNARHIRENKLGLTYARLTGIAESQADVLIFVDDDNVLALDYLEQALAISKDYPFIGTWGGQITPEFEIEPPEWTRRFWRMLAIREVEQDRWSNLVNQYETTPCGAGMCLRKVVAIRYAELVKHDPQRQNMDRKGNKLTSYGDSDIAFTACDMGFGTGQFTRLRLTHIMPATRLQESYLLRLVESSTYSGFIVESYRGKFPTTKTMLGKLVDLVRFLRMSSRDRRFHQAYQRGLKLALGAIRSAQDI